MDKKYFKLSFIIFSLFFISTSYAADLRWGRVDDTETCIIGGYNVYSGTDPESLTLAEFIARDPENPDVSSYSYNVDHLTPNISTPYYFAVSAVSNESKEGPKSSPISYTNTAPYVVGNPAIDFTENLIEISFNESNMKGAGDETEDVNNYSFNQGISKPTSILRINKTYQLRMGDLPENAIITMTLNNITDGSGHAPTSNTITINDDNNNNMADAWEAEHGITSPSDDPDNDGLTAFEEFGLGTDPTEEDSDNDGMDDGWENDHGLNPVFNDADDDSDNDGFTNIEEYISGSSPSNRGPGKPTLSLPADNSIDVVLTPELKTNAYVDNENDAHTKTLWQISTDDTFSDTENFAYELESYENLTTLTVEEFILDADQTYYWRVKFFDTLGGSSAWSDAYSFTTAAASTAPNEQQVPDGTIDINSDGDMDIASTTYKMVDYASKQMSMRASENVAAIDSLKAISPDEITDTVGKPSNLPVGLLKFKITVNTIGAAAKITIYFSEAVGNKWYKYDQANGWTEYSADYPANVEFDSEGRSVTLTLVDGGAGDSDGVANGVIVDPSGPSAPAAAATTPANSGNTVASGGGSTGDTGGSGCFINASATDFSIEKHVQTLRDFSSSQRILALFIITSLIVCSILWTRRSDLHKTIEDRHVS